MIRLRLCLLSLLVSAAFLAVAANAVSGDDPGVIRVPVAEDAYVVSNGNRGTSPLFAGSYGTVVYRSYLKFELPELPEDAEIKKVSLSAYSLVTGNALPEIAACPAGSGWSESTITWAEAPPVGEPCDTVTLTSPSGEYQWNVTEVVEPALVGEAAADGPGSDGSFTLVLTEAVVVADGWAKMANKETYPDQAAHLLIDTGSPDVTPPEIALSDLKQTLWPPNNKMVLCAVLEGATDDQDPNPKVGKPEVTSDEDIDGDWEVKDNGEVWLRAERDSDGDGRVYTVTVTASDESGNQATATIQVTVPHDQGE
jgi:hypothetical protein